MARRNVRLLSHRDRDGAQNVSLLARYVSLKYHDIKKKPESSRKELSGFFCVFTRMQSS